MSDSETFFVMVAEGDVKKMSLDQLDDAYRLDIIDESTLIWQEGFSEWQPLRDVIGGDDEEDAGDVSDWANIEPEPAPQAAPFAHSAPPPNPAPGLAALVAQRSEPVPGPGLTSAPPQAYAQQSFAPQAQAPSYAPQPQVASQAPQAPSYAPQAQSFAPQAQSFAPQGQSFAPQGRSFAPQGTPAMPYAVSHTPPSHTPPPPSYGAAPHSVPAPTPAPFGGASASYAPPRSMPAPGPGFVASQPPSAFAASVAPSTISPPSSSAWPMAYAPDTDFEMPKRSPWFRRALIAAAAAGALVIIQRNGLTQSFASSVDQGKQAEKLESSVLGSPAVDTPRGLETKLEQIRSQYRLDQLSPTDPNAPKVAAASEEASPAADTKKDDESSPAATPEKGATDPKADQKNAFADAFAGKRTVKAAPTRTAPSRSTTTSKSKSKNASIGVGTRGGDPNDPMNGNL